MPTLPLATAFTGSAITEAQFKTAITDQREFLASLLGTAGTQSAALAAIGALLSGVSAKTSAYTVLAADRGKLIDCTSGTFSLTLTAAATLGAGYSFAVRNSGTGVITIDPNAAELIDGVATITLQAGESCLLICNGTAWKTVGRTATVPVDIQTFNSSNNWLKPAKGTVALVEVWGAGGSGARDSDYSGSGGAGGGYAAKLIPLASLAASVSVTIGAGGSARATNLAGQDGGSTTFGSHLSGYGGKGGRRPTVDDVSALIETPGGAGGGGDHDGVGGVGGGTNYHNGGAAGGASRYGGGGGGGGASDSSPGAAAGGTSTYGGNGGAGAHDANNAGNGTQPGGGGGGAEDGTSGAGGNGRCVVTVF